MNLALKQLEPTIMGIFRHLHNHPEISWQEYETTAYLADLLSRYGYRIRRFEDCTGVVGEIGSGRPVVALRADMDALWQEVDGLFQAHHSCGHDAHMTMVFGTLLLFHQNGYSPPGTLRVIFQPAEEKGTGALKMVEKQVIQDVDYLYGVHLRPVQELKNGTAAPAILHGAARFITGEIIGNEAHAARPHLGTNVIEVGASFVEELGRIRQNPMVPHSVKMTRFTAGSESGNIIPGRAQFSLDLRAQTNPVMDELTSRVYRIAGCLERLHGVQIRLTEEAYTAAAERNQEAEQLMAQAIRDVLGAEQLMEPITTPGGEDFHFYSLKNPRLKATMLGLGCGLHPGLHHPQMTFDHRAILNGIEILSRVVELTFARHEEGNP